MTATHPDFLLYAGSSWQIDAALHDAAGEPLDLTGAAVTWTLYDTQRNPKLVLSLSAGIEVVNALGGLIKITATPAQTSPLPQGSYRDEIVVTMMDGFVCTQAVGVIAVAQPGALPVPQVEDPCSTLAKLQQAKLALISGTFQTSVQLEGFGVTYSQINIRDLDAAIARYETACRKATGRGPRRFAIGSGMRRQTY